MAKAKRCDRCGKYYVENSYRTGLLNKDLFIVGFRYIWNDGDTGSIIDLCDDCQAKLDKFMEMDENERSK